MNDHLEVPSGSPAQRRRFYVRFLFHLTRAARDTARSEEDPGTTLRAVSRLLDLQLETWDGYDDPERSAPQSLAATLRQTISELPDLATTVESAWRSAMGEAFTDIGDPRPLPAMRLYSQLAEWWPILSPPSEYEEESGFYRDMLKDACDGKAERLLELGSGGGHNASFLKRHFQTTVLVDLSEAMLDQSRRLNPECEHVQEDMRSVRLDRTFDCVFVHDAVCHMTTEQDLSRVFVTAYAHCREGGAALFAPDHVADTFEPRTEHGGYDGETRAMRYLGWTWDPDPDDSIYRVDYAYLLREADGSVRIEQDRSLEGLFPQSTWLRLLSEVGFQVEVRPVKHTGAEDDPFVVFIGRRAPQTKATDP